MSAGGKVGPCWMQLSSAQFSSAEKEEEEEQVLLLVEPRLPPRPRPRCILSSSAHQPCSPATGSPVEVPALRVTGRSARRPCRHSR